MPQQQPTPQPKRPWAVIILALITLLFSVGHGMKFALTIQQWDTLENVPLLVSPRYLALVGLGWGIVTLSLSWGLWMGKLWAWYGIQLSAALYYLLTWVDLAWIAAPDFAQTRWPVTLGISILGLICLFSTVYYPTNRRFF